MKQEKTRIQKGGSYPQTKQNKKWFKTRGDTVFFTVVVLLA